MCKLTIRMRTRLRLRWRKSEKISQIKRTTHRPRPFSNCLSFCFCCRHRRRYCCCLSDLRRIILQCDKWLVLMLRVRCTHRNAKISCVTSYPVSQTYGPTFAIFCVRGTLWVEWLICSACRFGLFGMRRAASWVIVDDIVAVFGRSVFRLVSMCLSGLFIIYRFAADIPKWQDSHFDEEEEKKKTFFFFIIHKPNANGLNLKWTFSQIFHVPHSPLKPSVCWDWLELEVGVRQTNKQNWNYILTWPKWVLGFCIG